MRTVQARIDRIERKAAEVRREDRAGDRALMSALCRAQLARQPEIAKVAAADTDPETFRHVREALAYARGDFAEAERLRALAPRDDAFDRVLAEEGGDHGRALARLTREKPPLDRAREAGLERALAAVRARAGGRGGLRNGG